MSESIKVLIQKSGAPDVVEEFQTTAMHKRFGVVTVYWDPDSQVWEEPNDWQYGPDEMEWWVDEVEITVDQLAAIIRNNTAAEALSCTIHGIHKASRAIISKLKGE